MSFLSRCLNLARPAGRQASAQALQAANEARDVRDWAGAARLYRAYLEVWPKHFDIWVQLGHAAKESGDLEAADAAYAQAERLRAGDHDLLINRGHLRKMRDDPAAAVSFYAASFFARPSLAPLRELAAPALAPWVAEHGDSIARILHQDVDAALTPHLSGLKIVASHGLIVQSDGSVSPCAADAYLDLAIDADLAEPLRLPVIELTANRDEGPPVRTGRIEVRLDREQATDTLHFRTPPDGMAILPLAGLRAGMTIRWHPGGGPCQGDRWHIGVRFAGEAELAALIDRHNEGTEERTAARAALTRALKDGTDAFPVPADLVRDMLPGWLSGASDYGHWVKRHATPSAADRARMADIIAVMPDRPNFSFVIPVYNPPADLLRRCLDSLLAQNYPDFEICLANDASSDPDVAQILDGYATAHPNVHVVHRPRNGHISAASNSALSLASNRYVVLVDQDDEIPDYTLFVVASYLNRFPNAAILYSDEDKITVDGARYEPYFKGDFNLFLMFGHNMISHLGIYERTLIEAIGGFRQGLEGSQDYDLFLRAMERAGRDRVIHIPHVLYHWRAVSGSTALAADEKSYAIVAARAAINGHFERSDTPLRSVPGISPGNSALAVTREYSAKVSIIVPTRDRIDLLRPCVESVLRTASGSIELIIVDNGSVEPETLAYLETAEKEGTIRVVRDPQPFNFSALNNAAAGLATGELLCFLNNDTEVRTDRWLDRARGLLALPDIGMVGARLLNPDGTLQHFGIGLGMEEHKVAGTPFAGLPDTAYGYFSKARMIQEVSAVTAACMFVRRADFIDIGGFDPALSVAYNDVDLCIRYRNAGKLILCDPEIVLLHKESQSRGDDRSGEKRRRLDREAAVMRDRWATILDNDPYLSPNLSLDNGEVNFASPPRVAMPWNEQPAT